jgi:hypothetical protein
LVRYCQLSVAEGYRKQWRYSHHPSWWLNGLGIRQRTRKRPMSRGFLSRRLKRPWQNDNAVTDLIIHKFGNIWPIADRFGAGNSSLERVHSLPWFGMIVFFPKLHDHFRPKIWMHGKHWDDSALRFFGDIFPSTQIIIKAKVEFDLMIDQSLVRDLRHDFPRQYREESREDSKTDTPIRENLANLQKIF